MAESLHLPRGLPGVEPEPEPGVLERVGGAFGELGAAVSGFGAPVRAPLEQIGGVVGWWWKGSGAPALVADVRNIAGRLLAWARSRADCVTDTAPPPGGGGSGHTVMAVAGINSSTDPKTGATFALDTDRLGYRPGEVRYFSYAPDGGAYDAAQTTGDLRQAAERAAGSAARARSGEHPGREVDLIGHSQGGVVIATFLEHATSPATRPSRRSAPSSRCRRHSEGAPVGNGGAPCSRDGERPGRARRGGASPGGRVAAHVGPGGRAAGRGLAAHASARGDAVARARSTSPRSPGSTTRSSRPTTPRRRTPSRQP